MAEWIAPPDIELELVAETHQMMKVGDEITLYLGDIAVLHLIDDLRRLGSQVHSRFDDVPRMERP